MHLHHLKLKHHGAPHIAITWPTRWNSLQYPCCTLQDPCCTHALHFTVPLLYTTVPCTLAVCTLQGANMELMLGLSTCGPSLPVILYFRLPCNQMMITITITITKTAQIYVSKCCFLQVCHCIVILSQKHLQYGFCLCQQLFTDCNPEQYDKWANIEERLQTNQSS